MSIGSAKKIAPIAVGSFRACCIRYYRFSPFQRAVTGMANNLVTKTKDADGWSLSGGLGHVWWAEAGLDHKQQKMQP